MTQFEMITSNVLSARAGFQLAQTELDVVVVALGSVLSLETILGLST